MFNLRLKVALREHSFACRADSRILSATRCDIVIGVSLICDTKIEPCTSMLSSKDLCCHVGVVNTFTKLIFLGPLMCAEEAPAVPHTQRQVAEALSRAAFSGAPDAVAAHGALASFSIQDCSGPKLSARLLRLQTQVWHDRIMTIMISRWMYTGISLIAVVKLHPSEQYHK